MKKKNGFGQSALARRFRRDKELHLMLLIPLIYVLIFSYGPMYGIQIAFRNYTPAGGITGSEWVGLKWFTRFLSNYRFGEIFGNTIILSLYNLVVTFPLPIIFALILNALRQERYKKVVQTVSYVPHFISVTVMVGILNLVFSPSIGLYGSIYQLFGGEGLPRDFRATETAFRHLYVWSGLWQNMGWNSIIYVAALSSVPAELHEAAQLDGASRIKRMWHVEIPAITPTIAILFIQRCATIASIGFEKAYLMQSSLNLKVSEVISTYVYKEGMSSFTQYSYGAAIGIFNLAINLALLFGANSLSKKLTEGEVSYF